MDTKDLFLLSIAQELTFLRNSDLFRGHLNRNRRLEELP